MKMSEINDERFYKLENCNTSTFQQYVNTRKDTVIQMGIDWKDDYKNGHITDEKIAKLREVLWNPIKQEWS